MNLSEAIASLQSASAAASELLAAVTNLAGVEEIERDFLGKRSVLVSVNEAIKDFAPEDRPAAGKAIGAYRAQVGAAIEAARDGMSAGEAAARIERERLDLTIGGRPQERGHLHLITQVQRELEDVFVGLGFQIAEGPEVETDWYNFE
ncbi:MAG: phenylalanine--tRNA ligase subunit alpha, partial [Actinobacteria bacterium]|nr:phenylalanine--tRNA ligase subunit alpha [Actinomycetota bacterium]